RSRMSAPELSGSRRPVPPRKATVVRNGTITGFDSVGIDLSNDTGSLVDTMILLGNTGGLSAGAGSTVRNSTIHDNSGTAIFLLGGGGASNNTIYKNGGSGVDAGSHIHMTVSSNAIARNGSSGIVVGDSSTVKDNTLLGNGSGGGADAIAGGNYTVVTDN